MSGWDTPSRPTWDQQDEPDDGKQAFSAPDTPAGDDAPWAAPAGSGWSASAPAGSADSGGSGLGAPGAGNAPAGPPPEFFSGEFEQRKPGASLRRDPDEPSWALPVRDGTGRSGNGAGAQAPAWEQAPARDELPPQNAKRQEYVRQYELSRQDEYGGQGQNRQDQTGQDFDRPGFGNQGFGSQGGFGSQEFGSPEFGSPGFGSPGFGSQDAGGQEFPRRQPGSAYSAAQQDYAQPDSAQPDSGTQQTQDEQAPSDSAHADWVMAARMDPALQDFFAPTEAGPGPGYAPRPGQVPQDPRAPVRPGDPRAPVRRADPWDDRDPAAYQPPGARGGPDGSGPSGGSGGTGGRKSPRGRASRIAAVSAVVLVVVGATAYLLTHKSGGSNAAGSTTPTVAPSSPAAAPSATATPKASAAASPHVSGAAAANGWVLSTPSVAGGYPVGTDPKLLAATTTTATAIKQSAVGKSGGTVTGKPVSASYTLPADQTIEFVGYRGTFNPKTVMANLGSFGSNEGTYPAGPHGGKMACANVPATATAASGGVCVWVTTSTLGVTEFFAGSAPEVLTVAQYKGADDTVKLRASVEKRKS